MNIPISKFVIKDRHGNILRSDSFTTVAQVVVSADDGVGEASADSSYEEGVLRINFHNVKADSIEQITFEESQEDGGINHLHVKMVSDSGTPSYTFPIKNGRRGNGIRFIDVEESQEDGGDNIVHIHCTDDEEVEGTTFHVKNGSRGNGIASVTEQTSSEDGGINTHTIHYTDPNVPDSVIHTRNGSQGRAGADRQPVESGDVIIAHSLGNDETKVMSQNAVSEALGIQALGSGLYDVVGNLSNMSELAAKSISNVGIITNSTVQGAKIAYFEVSSGDIVKINFSSQSEKRAAWGLFPDLNVDTEALQYENYVTSDMTIGKDYIFHVASAGYFAIYSLEPYDVSVMRVFDKAYKTFPGGIVTDIIQGALGSVSYVASRRCTDYIDVSSMEKILYTRLVSDGTYGYAFGMAFYDASKVFISAKKGVSNAAKMGYQLSVIDVPSTAKYARFSMWANPVYGEFYMGNAETDAIAANIVESSTYNLSPREIVMAGSGTTAVTSQEIYVKGERVVKLSLKDNDVPLTGSGSANAIIFEVDAYDNSGNVVETLFQVKNPLKPGKEILFVTPQDIEYFTITIRCNVGEEYVIGATDVTDNYKKKNCFLNVYRPVTRFATYISSLPGDILRCVRKGDGLRTNMCAYKIGSDETTTTFYDTPWDAGILQLANSEYDGIDCLYMSFAKPDNSEIFQAEVLENFDLFIYRRVEYDWDLELKEGEKRWELYGFNFVGLTTTSPCLRSNYLQIPKVGMSVRMDIPKWLKVRFRYGLRGYVAYTDFYRTGDVCTFPKGNGAVYAEFVVIGTTRCPTTDFYEDKNISLTILDANDGDVVKRNYDTEKWLGGVRDVPEFSNTDNLPLLVHVTDVHGDSTRFQSAFDYADYLGADLLVNTGDNYYFRHIDGADYMESIIKKAKSQYVGCLGNHDTYISNLDISTIYNTHIAPYAEEYGWHKESAEDVTDKCYYYKDLEAKHLRIIALDIYEDFKESAYKARISQTQIEWFIATLASTPEGYGVIVIMHQAPHGIGTIEGKTHWNDSSMDVDCASVDSAYMTTAKITGNPFGKIIDAFIGKTSVSGTYSQKNAAMSANETISYSADFSNVAEGVEFICYLNGHTHRDWIGYVKDCEHNQLNINLCSANPISQSTGFRTATDIFRDSNGVNQDAFNLYTVNREDKTVGIVRIGSCITKGLQERRVTFVSYV